MRASTLGRCTKLLVILTAITLLAATASAQFVQNHVTFTFQGCRNNGGIVLPNGSGQFICADAAYTTGDLGKGWNELDLVPHRLTTSSGNQDTASTDYDVNLAADYQTSGKIGYDVLALFQKDPNPLLSDASCSITTVGGNQFAGPPPTRSAAAQTLPFTSRCTSIKTRTLHAFLTGSSASLLGHTSIRDRRFSHTWLRQAT